MALAAPGYVDPRGLARLPCREATASSVEAIRVLAPNMEKIHVLKYGGERPPRLNWQFEGLAQSDCLETIDNIGVGFG